MATELERQAGDACGAPKVGTQHSGLQRPAPVRPQVPTAQRLTLMRGERAGSHSGCSAQSAAAAMPAALADGSAAAAAAAGGARGWMARKFPVDPSHCVPQAPLEAPEPDAHRSATPHAPLTSL